MLDKKVDGEALTDKFVCSTLSEDLISVRPALSIPHQPYKVTLATSVR